MSWPRQDNGTVDWESVFEDPDIGLNAYLKAAKTVPAVGQCAHVIVQSLFIREGDMAYRMSFNAAIDEVIHSARSEDQARERLLRLAAEIKGNRKTYATNFIDRNDTGDTGDDEHHRNSDDPTEALKVLKEDD